jgi:hypothetical protein
MFSESKTRFIDGISRSRIVTKADFFDKPEDFKMIYDSEVNELLYKKVVSNENIKQEAIELVLSNPNDYDLYTSSEIAEESRKGFGDGVNAVKTFPSAYNLVTQDAYDQMMNDLMSASDTNATHYTEGWFYHPSRGWMWTDRLAYPYFYDATDKDWMYFQSGNEKPKFYRYKTKTWLTVD